MHLLHVIDPRDALDKASRDEIYAFARRMGVTEITEEMYSGGYAKERMMRILRRRGLTNIQTPPRLLGQPPGAVPHEPSQVRPPMSLDQLMESGPSPVVQPERQVVLNNPELPNNDIAALPMGKLKKLAKERGIKQLRTDTRETLLAKING